MSSKIGFISLGCSKNQIDTEIMLKILVDNGYEIAVEDIHADIIIVNTCAFIESAKQEAIDSILDVAWLKQNRNLKSIIVCGCLAERYREEVLKELPEADALVGVFSIHDILEAVRHLENNYAERRDAGDSAPYISLRPQDGFKLGGERILTTPEYMAYIKIADGCNNKCAYCAIPSIRGRFMSRSTEDIVKEARELADIGVKELCVVAQDTTAYPDLPELLNKLCGICGIEWIRLLYCYPDKISDELISVIKNQEKILKYIDLPIQHINDKILASMNRSGTGETIKSTINRLRENIPGITIRTTVIAGFPGETKEMFGELCEFLKEIKFERLGSFVYSAEEGTPAAEFSDDVPQKEKERRQKMIMSVQERINYSLNKNKVGRIIRVLCEGFDEAGEVYFGRSEADAPEIDGKVYFELSKTPAAAAAPSLQKRVKEGDFVDVKITEILDYDLFGELVIL